LLCQDNSTGAAGNGDTKFKVGANGNTTIAGLTTMSGGGSLGAPTELTIGASDDITITGSYHTVDTAGDASSDDLVTINGGSNGQVLVLRAENSARTVVLKHGTGNIQCGSDISLDNAYDTVTLLYDSATSMWLLLASSNNGS
jgi:phage-related protein